MRKYILIILIVFLPSLLFSQYINRDGYSIWKGQMNIGSTDLSKPDNSAWLQIGKDSTTKGIRLPRVIDTSYVAGTSLEKRGVLIYQLSNGKLYYNNGSKWSETTGAVADTNYFANSQNLADSILYIDGDTLKFKNPVAGFGVIVNTTLKSNTYTVDTTAGKIATQNAIRDSINSNATYFANADNLPDSLLYMDGDTLKIRNPSAGWGINISTQPKKVVVSADTSSGKLATQYMLSLVGGGTGIDNPWTEDHKGKNYALDSIGRLSVIKKVVVGSGSTENRLLESERLSLSPWSLGANVAITDNVAADLETNNTMDEVNCTFASSNTVGQTITCTPGETIYVSWDVQRPSSGSVTDVYYQFYDLTNFVNIVNNSYFSSTSTTLSRYSTSFVVPAGCVSVIIRPFGDNSSTGKLYIGRVQAASSASNLYVETTGSAAPITGGFTNTYKTALYTNDSAKVFVGDSLTSFKLNVNGSIGIKNDSLPLNSAISDTALKVNAFTNRLERVVTKNFGNSNLTLSFHRVITTAGFNTSFTGSGKFGIGTSSLSYKLNVRDSISNHAAIFIENLKPGDNNTYASVLFQNDLGSSQIAGLVKNSTVNTSYAGISSFNLVQFGNVPIGFATNNLLRFKIDGDGSFVIGGSAGTSGQVLQSNGTGSTPSWVTLTSLSSQIIATDANITAATNRVYVIPSGVLTSNRNFDVSSIATDLNEVEIYNYEGTYQYNFTGGTVYLLDGITTVSSISSQFTKIKVINGKITIIN